MELREVLLNKIHHNTKILFTFRHYCTHTALCNVYSTQIHWKSYTTHLSIHFRQRYAKMYQSRCMAKWTVNTGISTACILESMEFVLTFKLQTFHLNSCCIYIEKLQRAVKRVYMQYIFTQRTKLNHFSEIEYEASKSFFSSYISIQINIYNGKGGRGGGDEIETK